MAAGRYDFTVEQGATLRKTITWKDSVGNPVNLTGYHAKLQLRDQPGGTIYLELSDTNGKITFNASYGQILLYMSPTDTGGLTVRKSVYDLEMTAPSGDITRLIQGKVTISQEVTR